MSVKTTFRGGDGEDGDKLYNREGDDYVPGRPDVGYQTSMVPSWHRLAVENLRKFNTSTRP